MTVEIANEDRKNIILSSINPRENTIFELGMFISRLQRKISNVQNNIVDAFVTTPSQFETRTLLIIFFFKRISY